MNIAVDGPSAAGKSTLCKAMAERLGYLYVDTGAMYRALAWGAMQRGVDIDDEQGLTAFLATSDIGLQNIDGVPHVFYNGKDVTEAIRTPAISMAASSISRWQAARKYLVAQQQDIGRQGGIVMDGRDIGTVVLPQAEVKIFLTASPDARARRRHKQLLEAGEKATFDQVLADIEKRDAQDQGRKESPLRAADDAAVLDTTDLTFDQSLAAMLEIVAKRQAKKAR